MKNLRGKVRCGLFLLLFGALTFFFAFRSVSLGTRLTALRQAEERAAMESLTEYASAVCAQLQSETPDAMLLFASALLGRDAASRAPLDEGERDSLRRFFGQVCREREEERGSLALYAESLLTSLLDASPLPYFPQEEDREALLPSDPSPALAGYGEEKKARALASRLLGSHLSPAPVPVRTGSCFVCDNACVRIADGRVVSFVREYSARAGEEISEETAASCAARLITLCGYRAEEVLCLGKRDGIVRFQAKTPDGGTLYLGVSAYSGILCLFRVGD